MACKVRQVETGLGTGREQGRTKEGRRKDLVAFRSSEHFSKPKNPSASTRTRVARVVYALVLLVAT